MKQIQYKGHFWLPQSEIITYGYLKWHNNTAFIELLSNPDSKKRGKYEYEVETLFGILNGQAAVTVVNCKLRTLSFPYADYIVNFEYLIYGYGSSWNTKQVNLNNFRFTFDHLFPWSNIRGIVSKGTGKNVRIERANENFNSNIYIGPNFDLTIGYVTEVPIFTHRSSYTATQETYIQLNDKLNLSFNEVFYLINKLTLLFRLITSAKFNCKSIITAKDDKNIEYFIVVNLFSTKYKDEDKLHNHYLFKYSELIKDDILNNLIDKYYKLSDEIIDNIKLITSNIEDEASPRQFVFLNLIYALDKLSGKKVAKYDAPVISTSDQKHISVLEKNKVPKNTIDYFNARIKRFNYTRLKDRLRSYLHSYLFIHDTQTKEEIEGFVEVIVNTRNDLSHGTKVEPILNYNQFEEINEILLNWISLILLRNLGVPEAELENRKKHYSL